MAEAQRTSISEAELKNLGERIAEIETLLLSGFPVALPKQHLFVENKLKSLRNVFTLYEILDSFRKALAETESLKKWMPKGGLSEKVLEACCNQRYGEHDIENIFYTYGGINGVFVLYLGTKNQTHLFPTLNALPRNMVVELAKLAGKESIPSIYLPAWISAYDKSKRAVLDPKKDPPRFYRWGLEKEQERERKSRKRSRYNTETLQTSSDVQSESAKETPQNPPTPENIPMRVDSQSDADILLHAGELPPPDVRDFDAGMAWDMLEDASFYNPYYVPS